MRIIDILLHNVALSIWVDLLGHVELIYLGHCLLENMVNISWQENSLTLTQTIWLDNIGDPFAIAVIQIITDPVVP